MPTYTITDPATGKTVEITGPAPPSEAVIKTIFAKIPAGERTADFSASNEKDADGTPVVRDRSMVAKATGAGPMVGATVGALTGGVPGAALGGAAGTGYEELIRHAKEIPGAVVDVARNLVTQPRATLQGFKEGALEGAETAGLSAAANAALEFGGQKVMGAIGSGANAIYRGYLKPSLAGHSINDAQAIVDTAIREGLPISNLGKEKAGQLIGELKGEVEQILKDRQNIARTTHGDIDLTDVANRVRTWARQNYYKAGRPPEDFEAAMRVADHIDAHPSVGVPKGGTPPPQPVTLTEANEVKRTLDASAGDRAFGVERSAATEAEKQGRRILRTELEARAPKIASLNARESKLIDAAEAIKRAIEREANQNALVGVKSVLAVGAGGVEYGRTGDPWSAAAKALALRYALSPARATKVAILASRLGKIPGVAPASAARVAMAVLSEQKADDEQ